MTTAPAFLHPLPLSCSPRCAPRIHRPRAVCRASSPEPPRDDAVFPALPKIVRPTRLPSTVAATAGALLGAVFSLALPFSSRLSRPSFAASPSTTASQPSSKQLRYDGRQELDSHEKAMSLTLTAGTFAALGVWAWKRNRRDDELETIRIKEEVDRLEKLRAEFMDVEEDDDSLNDEDLLASLKQRISEDDDDDTDPNADPDAPQATDESPAESDPASDDDSDAGPDSVDMLRRMWDATDDDAAKKDKP